MNIVQYTRDEVARRIKYNRRTGNFLEGYHEDRDRESNKETGTEENAKESPNKSD